MFLSFEYCCLYYFHKLKTLYCEVSVFAFVSVLHNKRIFGKRWVNFYLREFDKRLEMNNFFTAGRCPNKFMGTSMDDDQFSVRKFLLFLWLQ